MNEDPAWLHWVLPPNLRFAMRTMRGEEKRAEYKRLLRTTVNWVIPPAWQRLILRSVYRSQGVDVSANVELKNRHQGERCFVMGNGPSLGKQDLSPLADEITIGANSFYKHRDSRRVDLRYLCVGDASFMEDRPEALEWHRILELEHPHAEYLYHPDARHIIKRHDLYRGRTVRWFHRGVPTDQLDLVHCDLTLPLNTGMNTGTLLSIPLAIYMGCTEIYLLGFDCNWLDDYTGSYHFYDEHVQFPEFDSLAADERWPRYEDQLVIAQRDFEGHRLLAQYAQRNGIKIVNATGSGRLDTYPRVAYEKLVS